MASGMEDFFAEVEQRKHAWPAYRRDLHWHGLFNVEDVRRELTDPYHDLTHRPGLEPVAPQWLHLTVLHSGPEQEATPDEVAQIVEGVRNRCAQVAPFDVTFDRPAVGRVAIECMARPGAAARELWKLTYEATTAVVGDRWPLIPDGYYPHSSLAYAGATHSEADRRAMKIWLSDNGPGPVTLRLEKLSLVAQWHDHRTITWEHIADVPLAGA